MSTLEVFICDEYHDHYDVHHNVPLSIEADLLNSVKIVECRLCGSSDITKKGFTANGVQRYRCK